MRLFLAGDVMLGRGIDQILPHPSDPAIYEPWMTSARQYVALAERRSGLIPRPVSPDYVWGDALVELARRAPDIRLVNLETAITTHEDFEAKSINYRMHPANVAALTAAKIDACALANNHVLDWRGPGLVETLEVLDRAGIAHAGAGRTGAEASRPLVLASPGGGRLIVFALGLRTSGIPPSWAAAPTRPGVHLVHDFVAAVGEIGATLARLRRPGDLALASIHWGPNWGYAIDAEERRLAHALIDEAGIDLIHGHSSHHPKAIEIHRGRPILYGCGDFINDYEGIGGEEAYRPELVLGYFIETADGAALSLRMTPFELHGFRLRRPAADATGWLADLMDRECRQFGGRVEWDGSGDFVLRW